MSNHTYRPKVAATGRVSVIAGAIVATVALWYLATVPWGVAFWEVVPFMGPGALLAIGAGWMAYATTPERFTWKTARNAAITGALLLPPLIGVAFAILGARPERVLSAIVRGAWIAFIGGALWGLGMWLIHRSERRRA